jgi:hypothetical protein
MERNVIWFVSSIRSAPSLLITNYWHNRQSLSKLLYGILENE